MKYPVFCFILCCCCLVSFSQETIRVMEQSYICSACDHEGPNRFTIDSMRAEIKGIKSLQQAADKIRYHFKHAGDRFILFCKDCKDPRTISYIQGSLTGTPSRRKGLGTRLVSPYSGSGSNKGTEAFFKVSDLLSFLSDSVLIFDSVVIPLGKIADRENLSLPSTRLSFEYAGTPVLRKIPYNKDMDAFVIKYESVFGNSLDRDITDSIPVKIIYYDTEGNVVSDSDPFRLFFATGEEKQTVRNLFAAYKASFPGWTTEQIAKELGPVITGSYKNVFNVNFISWLNSIK